jgi:hypothetical protein
LTAVAAIAFVCTARTAWADDDDDDGDDEATAQGVFNKGNWPLRTIDRPLTIPGGTLELRGDTFILGMSSADLDFAAPIAFAPDVFYGINGQFSVGVTHTNHFPFFAAAGGTAGICLSGKDKVPPCPSAYNAIGAEAQYALTRGGNVGLMARGGISVPRFSDGNDATDNDLAIGLTAGLRLHFRGGNVGVLFDPNVYIGALHRDEFIGKDASGDAHADFLFFPVHIQYQLNTQTMVYLMSGLNAPFKGMGDYYQIPAGLGVNFALNNRMDVGAEFQFANIAGKDVGLINKGEERYLIARLAIRI